MYYGSYFGHFGNDSIIFTDLDYIIVTVILIGNFYTEFINVSQETSFRYVMSLSALVIA